MAIRGRGTPQIGFGGFLRLHRKLVVLFGIVAAVLCDQAAGKHGAGAIHIALQERDVGTVRVHL